MVCPESEVLGEVLNPAVTHENGHQIFFSMVGHSMFQSHHWHTGGRDREDAGQALYSRARHDELRLSVVWADAAEAAA